MRTQLLVTTKNFELLIDNKNVFFELEDIQNIELYKKVNWKHLACYFIFLFSSTILYKVYFNLEDINMVLLNLLIFLIYNDFIYKAIVEIKITIKQKKYQFKIVNTTDMTEFTLLYEVYKCHIINNQLFENTVN
jgi:hypothetical protein